MADEIFMNTFPSTMPTWESISSSMDIHRESPPNCFISPPVDHFDSALSSMVSSPTSAVAGDHFMIRELIGRLGNISAGPPTPLPPYINQSNPNSCYGTPLSSPPNMANENFPNLPAMPSDPGFAERAAKFSSFGSRSFNGRTTQIRVNNANNNGEFGYRSTGNFGKLQRVFSSPSLIKADGSQDNNCKNSGLDQGELSNSRENSSGSGQNRELENGSNRKRKAAPKGKTQSPLHKNSIKVSENGGESNAKRSKSEEEGEAKTEENRVEKQRNCNSKGNPADEPLKDYIHVRARRGQATDSHSLAERVRREKIGERMKLLQDLVPGCNKVTGKALMLDEIINYVQSLQKQVEFLSMKLSTVNSRLEFNNTDNLFSKDVIQGNGSSMEANAMYQEVECIAESHYNYNQQINQINVGGVPPSSMPLNHHSFPGFPFHPIPNAFPQIGSLCEGDLQSIVQMSYGNQMESGTNETPLMKIEF